LAARIGDRTDIVDGGLRRRIEAGHVVQRIALPAHAADFLVVMRIAVGHDVEAGDLLRAQETRDRVFILFAVTRVDHRLEETAIAEHGGVPGRRGSEPMIDVGSITLAEALYTAYPPAWQICRSVLSFRDPSNRLSMTNAEHIRFMANDCQLRGSA
jgi:hypothetical protein